MKWSYMVHNNYWVAKGCGGGVHLCTDCREFIVVSDCKRVHLSLSLLFFGAVYCVIQWVRNEACRKLGKMSKGHFLFGAFMSRESLWVMVCNWKWDRKEWRSACVWIFVYNIVKYSLYIHRGSTNSS